MGSTDARLQPSIVIELAGEASGTTWELAEGKSQCGNWWGKRDCVSVNAALRSNGMTDGEQHPARGNGGRKGSTQAGGQEKVFAEQNFSGIKCLQRRQCRLTQQPH